MPVTLTSLSLTSTDLPHFGVGADPDAALLEAANPRCGRRYKLDLEQDRSEWAAFRNKMALSSV